MVYPSKDLYMLPPPPTKTLNIQDNADEIPACVMCFNANDPSGGSGLAADLMAIGSVGAHALPVVTGAYVRDTREIVNHYSFGSDALIEQARIILEDVPAQAFKVGFVGTPENIVAIASLTSDYPDTPVVSYMPDLSWWDEDRTDAYLDAYTELLLPQTTVLVGNHNTLARWLLPDSAAGHNPTASDIAKAAHALGVSYTLVTGMTLPDQFIDNVLATPHSVLSSEKFERFEAIFSGAGDTLAAALAALIASGTELKEAVTDALSYLDRCLENGFRPGMGHVLPDRLFWADSDEPDNEDGPDTLLDFNLPPNSTRH